MKKILFSIMALLAIAGTSRAQTNAFSVADIELPKNYEAALTVNFQFDAADTYTGYSFYLQLPEELEFVMAEGTDVACTMGSCHDASHSVTANLSDGLVKVAGLSLSSKPLKGTSGVLLTFTIKPKAAVTVGQTFTGTIKDILLVPIEGAKQNLAESNFTVTIGADADLRTILDETSTTAPAAATGVDVRVKRTFTANQWNTICLPFAMSAAQCKAAFGDDVQLADFTSWSSEEDGEGDIVAINVGFTPVTAIEANHPYIIKVSSAITSFTADAVNIDPEKEPSVQVGKKKAEKGFLTGTYVANFTVPEDNLFLSGGKFWYSKGKTKMKAFRAYFWFIDVLASVEGSSAPVFISFNNETTGIKNVEQTTGDNKYYNLNGQYVENPGKGLYIQNGKKVIIK
jgi:hypothetical protein